MRSSGQKPSATAEDSLAGANASHMVDAIAAHQEKQRSEDTPDGNGDACERILAVLSSASSSS
jgi:hypothetical protein